MSSNKIIGGEKYISPVDWYEKKLKISNTFNYIKNKDEYAIAYLGINNFSNENNQIFDDLNEYYKNLRKMVCKKLYQNERDLRNNGSYCHEVFFKILNMQKTVQVLLIYMDIV